MAANLLEMLESPVGHGLVGRATTDLGESESAIRSALGVAMPALLAGLLQQGSTATGASRLFEIITGPAVDVVLGQSLLRLIVPPRTAGPLASVVSVVSGMKISSVTALLGMAASFMLAFLKNVLTLGAIDASGLARLLAGQREYVAKSLDDRAAAALGFDGGGTVVSRSASGVTGRTGSAPRLRTPWFWAAAEVLGGTNAAPGTSFTFDDLQFKTGSSRLAASSTTQLEQLAAVLRAYPDVVVSVRPQDAAANGNGRLAANRAAAVKQALVEMGILATRISVEGSGPNRSSEPNHRVDLVVPMR